MALTAWKHMLPIIAVRRRMTGPALWENWEYFVSLASLYQRRHPNGAYPKGAPRLEVPDVWLEADKAAGLVPDRWGL